MHALHDSLCSYWQSRMYVDSLKPSGFRNKMRRVFFSVWGESCQRNNGSLLYKLLPTLYNVGNTVPYQTNQPIHRQTEMVETIYVSNVTSSLPSIYTTHYAKYCYIMTSTFYQVIVISYMNTFNGPMDFQTLPLWREPLTFFTFEVQRHFATFRGTLCTMVSVLRNVVCNRRWPKTFWRIPYLYKKHSKLSTHELLIRYVTLPVAHAPGMPGTFSLPPTSKETAN